MSSPFIPAYWRRPGIPGRLGDLEGAQHLGKVRPIVQKSLAFVKLAQGLFRLWWWRLMAVLTVPLSGLDAHSRWIRIRGPATGGPLCETACRSYWRTNRW